MKITLVNSLSHRDYWYNLRKVYYNFYSLFLKYIHLFILRIYKSERTALTSSLKSTFVFTTLYIKPFCNVQICILQNEWCSQLYKGILAQGQKGMQVYHVPFDCALFVVERNHSNCVCYRCQQIHYSNFLKFLHVH
jgi:hypothetical protein